MSVQAARARRRPLTLPILLGALSLATCSSFGPTVQDAREQLTGLTGDEILACMGPPASIKDQGPSAVWSYSRTSAIGESGEVGDPSSMTFQYSPFTTNQSMDASGNARAMPPPQCTVALGFDQGRVVTVDFRGTWGGRLVRSSLCGGLVEPCLN
jgi:hypothetical protein